MSSMEAPATSSACSIAATVAGLRERSGRSSIGCSERKACPCRKTQRSSGTPSARAVAIEAMTQAAPWLTWSRATISRR